MLAPQCTLIVNVSELECPDSVRTNFRKIFTGSNWLDVEAIASNQLEVLLQGERFIANWENYSDHLHFLKISVTS